jgi:probable addiction module antidote protein
MAIEVRQTVEFEGRRVRVPRTGRRDAAPPMQAPDYPSGNRRISAQRREAGERIGGATMTVKTRRFDAASYLDTEERQAAYIAAALETGDAEFVRDALGLVARARGMARLAKQAGLNRESLYKALGESGNPEFGTVMRIVRALGLTLSARPAERKRVSRKRRAA